MENSVKTAGIIIIGNEILSGKVQDMNSFFLSSELWLLGIQVQRITVIPDEIGIIAQEVKEFSDNYTYVFTTGGVGPTHDDVTMAGIAKGFGVPLARNRQIIEVLSQRFNNVLNEALLKMAELPQGSEVVMYKNMRFPVISFRNIYIFPGIPEYLRNKFAMIRDKFVSTPIFLKRIFLNTHESVIAGVLNDVVDKNKDVSFGSYPYVDNPEYRVVITLESRSEDSLKRAFQDLCAKIKKSIIVRIE
jgi:molybdenum cofactor synthesis domain-containing protein